MSRLWNTLVEISVQPEDFPSGDTVGFMNITTWATSAETAQVKIANYIEQFDWHIVRVEEAKAIDEDFIADDDEYADMIERANANPEAIICGTFHGYKVN